MACVRNMCMYYRFFVNSSFDLLYLEGFRGIGDYCASLHVRRPKSLKLWSNKQYDCILVQQGCTWPKNCFDIKCCKAAIIFIPPISFMYHCTVFYSNIYINNHGLEGRVLGVLNESVLNSRHHGVKQDNVPNSKGTSSAGSIQNSTNQSRRQRKSMLEVEKRIRWIPSTIRMLHTL